MTPHDSPRAAHGPTDDRGAIAAVYGGASCTFDLLRCFGWGELLNLGWFTWPAPFALLNLVLSRGLVSPRAYLHRAQERLLDRSLRLLDVSPSDLVLDIACGRGRSTWSIAHRVAGCRALGIDIDAASLRIARGLHGCANHSLEPPPVPTPHFVRADAARLPIPDNSADRILALECAFHFPDRDPFVAECARVLRPGGRLVVVDFAWRDAQARAASDTASVRLVKGIWCWSDFSTRDEYTAMLLTHRFGPLTILDWSAHVTRPLVAVFSTIVALARSRAGRALLCGFNPLLAGFDETAWADLTASARAHAAVSRLSVYLAITAVKGSDSEG